MMKMVNLAGAAEHIIPRICCKLKESHDTGSVKNFCEKPVHEICDIKADCEILDPNLE
ncbi:MAG: hypothetical protein HXS51_05985 [Theionarchaea archaeon]|nr:hypothetical protein [Theionarchaea archaeon]